MMIASASASPAISSLNAPSKSKTMIESAALQSENPESETIASILADSNQTKNSEKEARTTFKLPPPVFSPTADRHIAAMVAVATSMPPHILDDNKRV
jgi:hypothetical protein